LEVLRGIAAAWLQRLSDAFLNTKPGHRGAISSTISAFAVICGAPVLAPPFRNMLKAYLKVASPATRGSTSS
jgi:hypothetical protein